MKYFYFCCFLLHCLHGRQADTGIKVHLVYKAINRKANMLQLVHGFFLLINCMQLLPFYSPKTRVFFKLYFLLTGVKQYWHLFVGFFCCSFVCLFVTIQNGVVFFFVFLKLEMTKFAMISSNCCCFSWFQLTYSFISFFASTQNCLCRCTCREMHCSTFGLC